MAPQARSVAAQGGVGAPVQILSYCAMIRGGKGLKGFKPSDGVTPAAVVPAASGSAGIPAVEAAVEADESRMKGDCGDGGNFEDA